jgi:hypothetical protein
MGFYINPTYTVGKALSIFLEGVHFRFLRNSFGLLQYRHQNLDKIDIREIKCDWLKSEKSKHVMVWSILLRMIRPAQVCCSGYSGYSGESTEPRVSRGLLAPEQEQQAY